MPRIQVEAEATAPRDAVFQFAEDFSRRLVWDASTARVRHENGAVIATVSFAGKAHLLNPFRMRLEYVSLLPPAMIAVNMVEGPVFFAKVKSVWRFEAQGERCTKVILCSEFRSRWSLLSQVIDPILSRMLVRDARRLLESFCAALADASVAEPVAIPDAPPLSHPV